jgi:hypothetical protein
MPFRSKIRTSKAPFYGFIVVAISFSSFLSFSAQALDPSLLPYIIEALETPASEGGNYLFNLIQGREACNQPQTVDVYVPEQGSFVVIPNGNRLLFNAENLRSNRDEKIVDWRCAGSDEISRCPLNTRTVVIERYSNTRWFNVGCSRN